MNIAIITGASSGLGREFARQIDRLSHTLDEVWLIARRRDRLEELASTLNVDTRIIAMDITNDLSMQQLHEILIAEKPIVRMLLNCAGFGLLGNFTENSLEEQLAMIELNCTALTKMTYQAIPYMKENSRIIQIASSAAFLPQPKFAIYAASKAYVLSFSEALGEELLDRKIYVTAVCPGPIKTEFFDIAEKYEISRTIKRLAMAEAPNVVRAALKASAKKRSISVYSTTIKLLHVMSKVVPTKAALVLLRVLR
ncbi:MAG: SDR family NAD(P)-dependent oxidoreductase [Lachnospiraceae bacterium]